MVGTCATHDIGLVAMQLISFDTCNFHMWVTGIHPQLQETVMRNAAFGYESLTLRPVVPVKSRR